MGTTARRYRPGTLGSATARAGGRERTRSRWQPSRSALLSGCAEGLKNVIVLEEDYYRLCPTIRVVTDVEQFDLRYHEGRHLENNGRTEEAAAEYEKATELYRGEYLVEYLYEDWTMVERERLSNTYIDMLVWLAAHYKEPDQLQESIQLCYRILEKDRAHENGHLLLTEAYALLGYYGRALHQHSLFQRALKSTHGTEPSVETVKRFEKVLARSIHGRSSGLGFARGKTDEYPAKAANTRTLIPTTQDHVGSTTPTSCRATRRGASRTTCN
jgi:DNA-binding SARP family transcriptional activator